MGVRVRTARFKGGRTAVQLVDDEVADGLRVLTHDVEALAEVHILDDVVHHHRLGHQTHDGEQTGGGAVHCKREAHSRHIRCHQGRTDVHAGVLFQNHGDDIRSARGCVDVEQDRRTDRREHNGKYQLQHRLVGQSAMHRHQRIQCLQAHRHHDGRINSADADALAQKDEAQHQQRVVGHGGEGTCRAVEQLAEHGGKAGHAAEGEVVWEFEKVDADDHDPDADGDEAILRQRPEQGIFDFLYC